MSEGQLQTAWAQTRVPVICNACDWRFFVPAEERGDEQEGDLPNLPARCPHCAADALAILRPGAAEFPYTASPELAVPFAVSEQVMAQRVADFAGGIPLPPPDLNPTILGERLRPLYLSMWLVDSDVAAQWSAEVGFDYEVVSHQERYADGTGWQTQEVRETRVRWEPRAGRLVRRYENIAVPALTTHAMVRKVLGAYDLRGAEIASPAVLDEALIRAPDRAPDAAWPEAELGIRQRAIAECQEAAGADHLQDFRWAPTYGERAWTLLLLPVYAAFYLDDDGHPQPVLINGQTGQITGARRGSLARAHRRSWTVGTAALILFVLSLALSLAGLLFPPLIIIGVLGALLAILIGIAAIVPTARVMLFNRREDSRRDLQSWGA